jgi:hypothetical protein
MAKDTSQVGVRLSGEVLRKLQKEPDGVSEAIRRRLDRTFELDKYDALSLSLMEAVLYLSRQVRLHTGIPWNENEGVRRTLMAALSTYTWSEMLGPGGESDANFEPTKEVDLRDHWKDPANWLPFDEDPKKLGHRLARAYIQLADETKEPPLEPWEEP